MSGNSKKAKSSGLPYHRIVVKLGTSLLTGGSDCLDEKIMTGLVAQIARLHEQGVEPIRSIPMDRDKSGRGNAFAVAVQ